MKTLLATVAAAALAAGGAVAQDQNQEQGDDPVAISSWNYDRIYSMEGLRGDDLLEMDVYGADGEDLGEVENVVIADDRITAIVVEVGGFIDIGDTHVIVPWDEVGWTSGGFETPVSEENVRDYDLWSEQSVVNQTVDSIKRVDDGGVYTGVDSYRLTDLVNDYVIADGIGVGYVDDAIFSRDGELEAVVWAQRGGYYAAPYRGPAYGYDPMTSAYELGFGEKEIEQLQPFEYRRMNDNWF